MTFVYLSGDLIKDGINKAKQTGESLFNKSSEGIKSIKNATNELLTNTGKMSI
jgi:hypothetical protein